MNETLTKDILDKTLEAQKEIHNSIEDIENLAKVISKKINTEGRIIFIGTGFTPELSKIILDELWFNFQINKNKFLAITAAKNFTDTIDDWKELEDMSSTSIFELDEIGLNSNDLIIGLSSSGLSRYMASSLKYAKELGCKTGVITNTKNFSNLEKIDYVINTNFDNPTVIGLASAEGGTIQKIILDLLIYNSMLFAGRIYKKHLVYIIPISDKLEKYSIKIIEDLLCLSNIEAKKVFYKNNKSTEITLISEMKNISSEEAKKLIKLNNYDFNLIL